MMTSNNALIPDPDKEDILASSPTDWPFMHLGLRMCGWGDHQMKYYLLGTPVIWWAGAGSLVVSLFVLGFYLLRMQRKYKDFEPSKQLLLHCSDALAEFNVKVNGINSSMLGKSRSSGGVSITVSTALLARNLSNDLVQSPS